LRYSWYTPGRTFIQYNTGHQLGWHDAVLKFEDWFGLRVAYEATWGIDTIDALLAMTMKVHEEFIPQEMRQFHCVLLECYAKWAYWQDVRKPMFMTIRHLEEEIPKERMHNFILTKG